MTTPSGRHDTPVPAREVSQMDDLGIPTLTDSAGRPIRDTASASATSSAIHDAGYGIPAGLRGPAAEAPGLNPNLGARATSEVLRQVLTDHARTLQAEVHNALNSQSQAATQAAEAQRQAAADLRAAASAIRGESGRPGERPPVPGPPRPPGVPSGPHRGRDRSLQDQEREALSGSGNGDSLPNTGAGGDAQPTPAPGPQERVDERGVPLSQILQQEQERARHLGFGQTPETEQGFRQGRSIGIEALRSNRLLHPLAQRLQNFERGPRLVQDEQGNYRHQDENGEPGQAASEEDIQSFIHNQRLMGRMRGLGERLEQGGIRSVLPLGEIGVAVGIGEQAIGFMHNQREANRQFQTIEGGTNLQGMAERARGGTFGLSQMGTMGGEQARQLFFGATEAGFRGSERNNALDFATQQFRRNGTSVAQTLQLMTAAAETGGKSLTGVSAALNQMTDLARQNGQNAEQLRQRFTEQFGQVSQNIGSGTGAAAAIASTNVAVTAGQGERFANVTNAGLNTEVGQRLQANAMGMTFGQYIARTGRNPALNARGESAITQQAANAALGGQAPMIQQRLQELRQRYGQNVPQEELTGLANQLMESGQFDPGQAEAVENALGTGQGLTPQNAAEYVIRQLSGAADPATRQQQQVRDASPRRATREDLARFDRRGNLRGAAPGAARNDDLFHKIVNLGSGVIPMPDRVRRGQVDPSSPEGRYEGLVKQSGQVHPVVESLLQNMGNDKDARVRVRAQGGDREVTISDAIKYYSDQLDTGNNVIVGGSQSGRTISQITGGMGTQQDPGEAASSRERGKHGKAYKEGDERKGEGGTVTISPAPLLQQWFQFSGTGNVAIQSGRDTGTPPGANVTPQQRPTG